MTSIRLWGVIALAAAALSCGDEETGCKEAADCTEVVCPDGSKLRECRSGQCTTSADCPTGSGGW